MKTCGTARLVLFIFGAEVSASMRRQKMIGFNASSPATQAFLTDLKARDLSAAVLLDVGSNNGMWADAAMKAATLIAPQERRGDPAPVNLFMFEVQPRFFNRLGVLAARWNGSFVPRAVWTSETNLTLHVSGMKVASSLVESMARRHRREGTLTVGAIDFAQWLHTHARPLIGQRKSVFMKLDVEGAEFDILPHLLVRGSLCLVDHILIEWHVNAMPAERRLSGVGLRLALDDALAHGCPAGMKPRTVEHEVPFDTNGGLAVPGLPEEAVFHEPSGQQRYYWTAAHRRASRSSQNSNRSSEERPEHLSG